MMTSLRRLLARVRSFVAPRGSEREMEREIGAHLALLQDDLERRGMSPGEARRAARLALGGADQTRERHRDARSFPWLEDLRRDVPYALRGLRRTPGFTLAAVLTLALGIGSTATIYSVVRTILLEPLPYRDSDRIVRIDTRVPSRVPGRPPERRGLTYAEFQQWRSRSTTLSTMVAAAWNPQVMVPMPQGAARLSGGPVSPEWFDLLGTRAMLGRTLQPSDVDRSVVVLSARTWRRYFRSDPQVIGKSITLDSGGSAALYGQSMEVIGVMPDGFEDPTGNIEFWVPLAAPGTPPPGRRHHGLQLLGQLAPGVTRAAAEQEARTIVAAIWPPRANDGAQQTRSVDMTTLKESLVEHVTPALRVLLAAVVVVLLIVCANVAGLLLARGTARHREMAVRLAIGASRGRIVRQLLAESVVLALAGGLLGAIVAAFGLAMVKALATIDAPGVFHILFGGSLLPRVDEIAIDAHVLLLAIGLALTASLLFGLAPALQVSRARHLAIMGTRAASAAPAEGRMRSVLVVGQLVMATVLLVGAGLLAHSFIKLSRVPTGYDPGGLLAFQLALPEDYTTDRKAAVVERILDRLRSTPGVRVGFSYAGALVGVVDTVGYFVPSGRSADEMRQRTDTPAVRSVSYDYFPTMGVRLIEGRHLSARDDAAALPVALINRSLARQFFGNARAAGATLVWHGASDGAGPVPMEVIGVVDDMPHGRIDVDVRPHVFLDYRQMLAIQERWKVPKAQQARLALGFMSFAARADGDPAGLGPTVRAAVTSADSNAGIDAMAPLDQLLATSIARPRFYAVMLGTFAVVAAVLAAVGLYGVLAYAVQQRTREIGVRMALGAERRTVLALVLWRGLALTAIGLTLGVAGAVGVSRYLASMLFELTPLDPATYVLAAAGFAGVSTLAAYLPARRATEVDPIVALRSE